MIRATKFSVGDPFRAINAAIIARAACVMDDPVFIRRVKRQIQDQTAGAGLPPVL